MSNSRYVTNRFKSFENDGRVRIILAQSLREISANRGLIEILERINHSMSESEILGMIDKALFNFLRENYLIVEDYLFPLFSGQLLQCDHLFDSLEKIDSRNEQSRLSYGIIGLGFDLVNSGAIDRSIGATLIKKALGMQLKHRKKLDLESSGKVYDYELNRIYSVVPDYFYDLGEIKIPKLNNGEKELSSNIDLLIKFLTERKVLPLFYGADHSITYFIVNSLAKIYNDLTVIHFDAHCDLYISPHDSDDYLNHANVFRKILSNIENIDVIQLGVREFFFTGATIDEVPVKNLKTFSSKVIAQENMETFFENLDPQKPVYISFDADVLDPSFCPDTGSPVPGGISYFKALELVDYLTLNFNIVGADFVEIIDGSDKHHGAQIVANLISRVLLNSCTFSESNFEHSYEVSS